MAPDAPSAMRVASKVASSPFTSAVMSPPDSRLAQSCFDCRWGSAGADSWWGGGNSTSRSIEDERECFPRIIDVVEDGEDGFSEGPLELLLRSQLIEMGLQETCGRVLKVGTFMKKMELTNVQCLSIPCRLGLVLVEVCDIGTRRMSPFDARNLQHRTSGNSKEVVQKVT
jgi:hypothetical protein